MKIKYIINARIPTEKAHGYQICKMCEEFARAGHNVELIVPRKKDNSVREDVFAYYGLESNFAVTYLGCPNFVRLNPYIGRLSWYLQVIAYLAVLFFQKPGKECIIYTRDPEIVWLFKKRGYRVACEIHEWFGRRKKLALNLLKGVDWMITTNKFIKEKFVDNGFAGKRILVAPNGINLPMFALGLDRQEARSKLSLDEETKELIKDRKLLVYTGSFETMGVDKGIKEIFASLKQLDRSDVMFLAVGGSEKEIDKYEALAGEAGVKGKTSLLPRVSRDELAKFGQAADILLMPFPDKAHYKYFMSPLKTFEYMAAGRPIIASDLPSIREILEEDSAFFCRAGDSNDLAEKINYVLDNPGEGEKRAAKAHEKAGEYTWERRAERVLKFIE